MAKAREPKKKVAYRKRNQNRFSMVLIIIVVVLLTVTVAIRCAEMSQRLDVLEAEKQELQEQIDAEEARAEEIAEFDKYTDTKAYVEEVATEKLGLVYDGEIVFKEED